MLKTTHTQKSVQHTLMHTTTPIAFNTSKSSYSERKKNNKKHPLHVLTQLSAHWLVFRSYFGKDAG